MERLKSLAQNLNPRQLGMMIACAMVALMVAAPSFATDPTIDYSAGVAGGKTELVTAISTILPLILGIIGVMAGVHLAVKWFKRAAKSA